MVVVVDNGDYGENGDNDNDDGTDYYNRWHKVTSSWSIKFLTTGAQSRFCGSILQSLEQNIKMSLKITSKVKELKKHF